MCQFVVLFRLIKTSGNKKSPKTHPSSGCVLEDPRPYFAVYFEHRAYALPMTASSVPDTQLKIYMATLPMSTPTPTHQWRRAISGGFRGLEGVDYR